MAEHELDVFLLPHGLRLFVETVGLDDAVTALSEEQGNLFFIPDKPTPTWQGRYLTMRVVLTKYQSWTRF
ncbi:hypothetical protein [Pseudoalteromonas luteoviolacea]|uniref:hypothetical protein n=1 Tax=Pseudoalteromonas luteoviolacea TaxID=43657 RepID=UPI00163BB7A5|nr:hypothetical protein [Pseudoalteromonas luteoviolacea]